MTFHIIGNSNGCIANQGQWIIIVGGNGCITTNSDPVIIESLACSIEIIGCFEFDEEAIQLAGP